MHVAISFSRNRILKITTSSIIAWILIWHVILFNLINRENMWLASDKEPIDPSSFRSRVGRLKRLRRIEVNE